MYALHNLCASLARKSDPSEGFRTQVLCLICTSTLSLAVRTKLKGKCLGCQFDGVQVNGCTTKFVFKPASSDNMWKVVCEPKQGDLRLLTKKIPIGPLLHLQVFVLYNV